MPSIRTASFSDIAKASTPEARGVYETMPHLGHQSQAPSAAVAARQSRLRTTL